MQTIKIITKATAPMPPYTIKSLIFSVVSADIVTFDVFYTKVTASRGYNFVAF